MFSSNGSQVASNAANYIEDVFSTYLYTGNGSTQTITNGIDLSGKGGLVWIKDRTLAQNNGLYDTTRGATKLLISNQTSAEQTLAQSITSFGSSGFSVGTFPEVNENTDKFASWTFRKQPKFFDIVTYTGDGASTRYIPHNLTSVPGCVIIKRTDTTSEWKVGIAGYALQLNTTDGSGATTLTNGYVSTADFTSTDFVVKAFSGVSAVNATGGTYIAYLFAHNAGGFGLTGTDNVISCGSFTTDATTGAATVNLGWEPQWILTKMSNGLSNWTLFDNMRGMSLTNSQELSANASSGESSPGSADIFPSATGFSVDYLSGSGQFGKNKNIIYIAIRRGPMKVPTDATKVFNTVTATGGPPVFTPSFVTDMAWTRVKNSTTTGFRWVSRLLSGTYADSSSTAAEAALAQYSFDYQNGWRNATVTDSTLLSWSFQRAPSFFDEVCYTGTGVTHTETHNLGVAPELMIFKTRNNGSDWMTYAAPLGATKRLLLNGTNAAATDSFAFANTAPTSTVFTVGTSGDTNPSGLNQVAYLFASCPGVSKVGSYTGTGVAQTINCGFTAGARFVLIKRTDAVSDWYVWDTARGIVSGNDPYLLLNSTAAEVTITDYISPQSSGFGITTTAATTINVLNGTYIFLAIA